ncbi:hypothetical protein WICMUC_001457 [Wickerhamomyces mucosus]|uniref:Protein AHC1 n=1 Tax=Wickerhamomyces mucosus TaxID=1378264 RepID=A0A9P8TH45_9ASCO|nr:hypothetical protein WICMUC_001457 [Wickerhamomyces mucosus]
MSPRLSFNEDTSDSPQNNSTYLQVATPKSPNSDGFSPDESDQPVLITSDEHLSESEKEIRQNMIDQVNIEILLKHREYNLVQKELSKVTNQIDIMRKLHDDPNYSKFIDNLINFQNKAELEYNNTSCNTSMSGYGPVPMSSNGGNGSLEFSSYSLRKSSVRSIEDPPRVHRTSYGGIHPIVDANGNKICVHKRSDGVIVKVECPSCGRTDFGSAQGFLNHSRLAHQVEYKSQDHAALMCGIVLPEIEQDELGTLSLEKLRSLGMDVDKNLAPGVRMDEGANESKKKRRLSRSATTNQFLESLYSKNHDVSDFKDLIETVTKKDDIALIDDEDTPSPNDTTGIDSSANGTPIQPTSNLKKSHNRRKSRGGLSSVKFEEDVLEFSDNSTSYSSNSISLNPSPEHSMEGLDYTQQHIYSSYSSDIMTPAQRRRIPTIPNPLRTRSRSSRENSN